MALQTVHDQNIAFRVTDELRAAIHAGELAPGERLVERKLAGQLGVSHIPVREALTKLAEEGLIERLPRRGARVAALTERDLEEISSLRTLLEQFVVVRVQEQWAQDLEAPLRDIVTGMVEATERGDTALMFELDRRFHEQLWELADHRLLMNITAALRSRINGFLRAANAALEPSAQVAHAHSHAELLDAIASGDPDIARATMAEHIAAGAARIAAADHAPEPGDHVPSPSSDSHQGT